MMQGTNASGTYGWSKFQNSGVRSFGKDIRQSINAKSITPGPGTYRAFSELGEGGFAQGMSKSKSTGNL